MSKTPMEIAWEATGYVNHNAHRYNGANDAAYGTAAVLATPDNATQRITVFRIQIMVQVITHQFNMGIFAWGGTTTPVWEFFNGYALSAVPGTTIIDFGEEGFTLDPGQFLKCKNNNVLGDVQVVIDYVKH